LMLAVVSLVDKMASTLPGPMFIQNIPEKVAPRVIVLASRSRQHSI